MEGGEGPQLTWSNIVATIAVLCVMAAGAYKIVESEFEFVRSSSGASVAQLTAQIIQNRHDIEKIRDEYLSLREHASSQASQDSDIGMIKSRLFTLEAEQRGLIGRAAHVPVESKEVDQLSSSVDKRIDLLQQQINDINRQIAASVLQKATPLPK
jgi:TolA-binding protein